MVLAFAAFSSVSSPKPWIHPTGRDFATQAIATILVTMDGTFEWGRTTGKKSCDYMQTPDGSVRPNTVTVRAR